MGRRRGNGGLLDLVMELATRLPWWVSLGVGIASYLVLNRYAEQDIAQYQSTKDLGAVVIGGLYRQFAAIGQYLLPLLFGIGALASVLGQKRRTALVSKVGASDSRESLNEMSWGDFEGIVQEYFRLRGWTVSRIGGDGPDGGVDLELRRGEETCLVQCKQWRTRKVGVKVIRELYGVMTAGRASSGIVVTSGEFTNEAIDFASDVNVTLIDGPELFEMIKSVRSAAPRGLSSEVAEVGSSKTGASGCPVCGRPMRLRTARRGPHKGQSFYGCSAFPSCRGTIGLD